MADKPGIYDRDLEILDRIASGKSIYSFVCANGKDVIRAAEQGAEAIRFKQKLDEKLWEEIDERNVSVLSQDSKEVHCTQGSLL